MDATVVVALVSGLCVAIPSIIATILSNKSNSNLMLYRINQLEEKVNKHNNVIERMAIVERDIETAWSKIDEIRENVHELEEKVK